MIRPLKFSGSTAPDHTASRWQRTGLWVSWSDRRWGAAAGEDEESNKGDPSPAFANRKSDSIPWGPHSALTLHTQRALFLSPAPPAAPTSQPMRSAASLSIGPQWHGQRTEESLEEGSPQTLHQMVEGSGTPMRVRGADLLFLIGWFL